MLAVLAFKFSASENGMPLNEDFLLAVNRLTTLRRMMFIVPFLSEIGDPAGPAGARVKTFFLLNAI